MGGEKCQGLPHDQCKMVPWRFEAAVIFLPLFCFHFSILILLPSKQMQPGFLPDPLHVIEKALLGCPSIPEKL